MDYAWLIIPRSSLSDFTPLSHHIRSNNGQAGSTTTETQTITVDFELTTSTSTQLAGIGHAVTTVYVTPDVQQTIYTTTTRTTVTVSKSPTSTVTTTTTSPTQSHYNSPPAPAVETRIPFDYTCRPGDAGQKESGGMSLSATDAQTETLCEWGEVERDMVSD